MSNDEQVFDFMAAAEESGRQLDALIKRLPDDMVAIINKQWQQSPWRSELPKAATSTIEAAKSAEMVSDRLWKTAKIILWMATVVSIVIPLAMYITAYLDVGEVRRDEDATKKRIQALEERESSLRFATGGGADFYQQDGVQYFTPPVGALNCEQSPRLVGG